MFYDPKPVIWSAGPGFTSHLSKLPQTLILWLFHQCHVSSNQLYVPFFNFKSQKFPFLQELLTCNYHANLIYFSIQNVQFLSTWWSIGSTTRHIHQLHIPIPINNFQEITSWSPSPTWPTVILNLVKFSLQFFSITSTSFSPTLTAFCFQFSKTISYILPNQRNTNSNLSSVHPSGFSAIEYSRK